MNGEMFYEKQFTENNDRVKHRNPLDDYKKFNK